MVRVFRNREKPKRLQLVVSPSGSNVDFVATNYTGEAEAGQQHCNYAFGVLDKEPQTLKILPIASNKQGYKQDILSDTFWLMSFFESASLIGSQVLSSWQVGNDVEKTLFSPSFAAVFFAIRGIICITKIKGYGCWHGHMLVFTFPLQYFGFFGPQRWWYVPNESRGGMINLSQAPVNAATLLFLVQEVKECAISCMGLGVSKIGDNLKAELPACLLYLLIEWGMR